MKYSDPKLHKKVVPVPEYKLVERRAPKPNGRFISWYRSGYYYPINRVFNFAVMTVDNVNEIFKDDGKLMIVENIGRADKIVLPDELKKLIIDNDILFKDEYKSQKEIDDCLQKHINEVTTCS